MRILSFLMLALLVVACNDAPTPTENVDQTESTSGEMETNSDPAVSEPKPEASADPNLAKMIGYYVGNFEAMEIDEKQNYTYMNRINISVEKIGDGQVSGRSIVAGNDRPFSGTYEKEDNIYHVKVSEPGDDRYDGKFIFDIFPMASRIEGTWKANDKSLAVSERTYELEQRAFNYSPNLELSEDVTWAQLYNGEHPEEFLDYAEAVSSDVVKFNPSKVALKKEDIENMYRGDLEIIRNSIYARHGYSFKNRKMRYIFDHWVEWYIPVSVDVRGQLTELEKQNIELIKRYEDHAEKYYDSFGR